MLEVRLATITDCDILFEWFNEKTARDNAINSNLVDYEHHRAWFEERLVSPTTKIFIITLNNTPIGQIRIDISFEDGVISYSIAPHMRGKGYGSAVLEMLPKLVAQYDIKVSRLVGKVKHQNEASKHAFIKAGYRERILEAYIEYDLQL